jgi:hypothetical protein
MDIWTLGLLSFSLQEGKGNLPTGGGFINRPVLPNELFSDLKGRKEGPGTCTRHSEARSERVALKLQLLIGQPLADHMGKGGQV